MTFEFMSLFAKFKDPSTNWKYILIVVVSSLVFGVAILYDCHQSLLQMEAPLTRFQGVRKEEKIKETEGEKPAKNQIADWKTYENHEYKYEIKYPKDYLIQEKKIIRGLEEEQSPEYVLRYRYDEPVHLLHRLEIYHPLLSPQEGNIGINIWSNSNNFTVDQWLDYVNKGVDQGLLYEGRFISNREWVRFKGTNAVKGEYGCCTACIQGIFISKEEKIYNLELIGFVRDDECFYPEGAEEIYNHVLSTFQFLE